LNNFHTRKIERRKKAVEEKKIKDKEARTLEKQQVFHLLHRNAFNH